VRDRVCGFCLLCFFFDIDSKDSRKQTFGPRPPKTNPQHLLQTRRSGSLSIFVRSHSCIQTRRGDNTPTGSLLAVFLFHPVTLHHLPKKNKKKDDLTILPASDESLGARWEITDLKSSRRASPPPPFPHCPLLFPCHCIAGRGRSLSVRAQETEFQPSGPFLIGAS